MAMANILQSLGDAIERQQQRKHENNMEVLRAIYTRPGMIVLGVILLGAALALIWPQIAPEADTASASRKSKGCFSHCTSQSACART